MSFKLFRISQDYFILLSKDVQCRSLSHTCSGKETTFVMVHYGFYFSVSSPSNVISNYFDVCSLFTFNLIYVRTDAGLMFIHMHRQQNWPNSTAKVQTLFDCLCNSICQNAIFYIQEIIFLFTEPPMS